MRVTFAGVGEAFDEKLPNTSLLVETDGGSSVLLDCGFTASCAFWEMAAKPLELDAVYVSHFHADHYFGIPALITRSIEEKRTKRLTIIGPSGIEQRITRLMEMGFANALSQAKFEVFFIECVPGEDFKHSGFKFQFALSYHTMPCLSILLEADGKCVFYSGDGKPTEDTMELARGCDLMVHEAYTLDEINPVHGDVGSSLEFARRVGAKAVALVHMKRTIRHSMKDIILRAIASVPDVKAFLPEPGDVHIL